MDRDLKLKKRNDKINLVNSDKFKRWSLGNIKNIKPKSRLLSHELRYF